jgi:hypothetical protein
MACSKNGSQARTAHYRQPGIVRPLRVVDHFVEHLLAFDERPNTVPSMKVMPS